MEDYDFLLKLLQEPSFKPYKINEPLTYCTFHTKRSSVSTDTTNTQKAIDYIREHYVKTVEQARNFDINASYILAYPHIMNLSRKAANITLIFLRKQKALSNSLLRWLF
ncbi:putative UDP-galactose--lipooligosaccharide galactosyltransferase [Haemophilus influenzae]|uniref:Putative UDP-galactose--lipooligosaccharide galactosyltransferase n=1 Tax=Haemophilus influenzae TaxID=727 RepID=A0A2X1PK46_HAEIF|nr:putative UDP-galactose--lipooligosaccharide galactosyltransferase [Haemophilus influenzae]